MCHAPAAVRVKILRKFSCLNILVAVGYPHQDWRKLLTPWNEHGARQAVCSLTDSEMLETNERSANPLLFEVNVEWSRSQDIFPSTSENPAYHQYPDCFELQMFLSATCLQKATTEQRNFQSNNNWHWYRPRSHYFIEDSDNALFFP